MNDRAGLIVRLGVACFWALGPAEAEVRAADLTVSLDYDAVPGCPDIADLKSVVIARLGRDPFDDSAPDHVRARITTRPHGLQGRLEWRDLNARRTGDQTFPLASTDCVYLTRVMGFALAVQIQFLATASAAPEPERTQTSNDAPAAAAREDPSVERPVTPPPTDTLATTASPEVPVVVSPSPPPKHGPGLTLGVGPSVGVGMSSKPLLLGRIFGGLDWPHASIELAAQVSQAATTRRADGAGFKQQQLLLGLAGCAILAPWRACALANAGVVRMAGEQVDVSTSATVPVIEAGARVGAVQRLGGHGFLSAYLDGLTVVSRWTATLDHVPVWTAPRFAAALGLDAGVRFP